MIKLAMFLMSLAYVIFCQQSLVWASSGKLHFERMSAEYAAIAQGEVVEAQFHYTNRGPGPVIIQGIHSPCGCTVVDIDLSKKIQVGESGSFTVRLDTSAFAGKIQKSISIVTDETEIPSRVFTIQAEVLASIRAHPPLIDFERLEYGQTMSARVIVEAIENLSTLKLSKVVSTDPQLILKWENHPKGLLIHVTSDKPLPGGFYRQQIELHFEGVTSVLRIPVRGHVDGFFMTAPKILEFGALRPNKTAHRTIKLSLPTPSQLQVQKIALKVNGSPHPRSSDFIKVKVPDLTSDQWEIPIEFSHIGKQSGSVHGTITVVSSQLPTESVELNFYGFLL